MKIVLDYEIAIDFLSKAVFPYLCFVESPRVCLVFFLFLFFGKSSPELVGVQARDTAIQKLGTQDLVKAGEVLRMVLD